MVEWKFFAAVGGKQVIGSEDSPGSMYSLTVNVRKIGGKFNSYISQTCKSCYESISLYIYICITEAVRGGLDFYIEGGTLKP